MANVARYEKGFRRVRKSKPGSIQDLARGLQDNLVDNLSALPEAMAEELAHFYFGVIDTSRSIGDYYDLATHCILLFDLVNGEYSDHADDRLNDQEWEFIKNLTNDYADVMDENTLTTIMTSIVSQGRF